MDQHLTFDNDQTEDADARRFFQCEEMRPNRDTVVSWWCLEYELTGSDKFVEGYYVTPAPDWIHALQLSSVHLCWVRAQLSRSWRDDDSKDSWYQRKRCMHVIKTIWFAQSADTEQDKEFWAALCERRWPGQAPSWEVIGLVLDEVGDWLIEAR